MKVEASGVVFLGECEIQTTLCTARTPAPITAVFSEPGRRQINVCRACLEEMVRFGDWEIPGARIGRRADLEIRDRAGQPQVIVEFKTAHYGQSTSLDEYAERIHRNLLVHDAVPYTPWFWLVFTNGRSYLWNHSGASDIGSQFDFAADLLPYWKKRYSQYWRGYLTGKREPVSEHDFSQAFVAWLSDIQAHPDRNDLPDILTQTGLLQVLRDAVLEPEAVLA